MNIQLRPFDPIIDSKDVKHKFILRILEIYRNPHII